MSTAKGVPNLMKPPTGRIAKPAVSSPTPPVRFYVVESADQRIKNDHGDFVLRRGKEIRSDQYDVAFLKARGVQLREISTPGWYIDAQTKGREKAIELRTAGHDVEVPPEYEPINVEAATAPASPAA